MSRHNWQDAPDWANWVGVDSFSGKVVWFQNDPGANCGWTYIEKRPVNPSDTIKELSDMCFGGEQVDHAAELAVVLEDMLGGWRYIREVYGDLYGVGWTRCQTNAETALANYKQSRGEQ